MFETVFMVVGLDEQEGLAILNRPVGVPCERPWHGCTNLLVNHFNPVRYSFFQDIHEEGRSDREFTVQEICGSIIRYRKPLGRVWDLHLGNIIVFCYVDQDDSNEIFHAAQKEKLKYGGKLWVV